MLIKQLNEQTNKKLFKTEWTTIYLNGVVSSSEGVRLNETCAFLYKSSGLQDTIVTMFNIWAINKESLLGPDLSFSCFVPTWNQTGNSPVNISEDKLI